MQVRLPGLAVENKTHISLTGQRQKGAKVIRYRPPTALLGQQGVGGELPNLYPMVENKIGLYARIGEKELSR